MRHQHKRTLPVKKAHRAALDLTTNTSKTERLINGAKKRYIYMLKAKAEFDAFISKHVLEGIITEYNQGLSEDQHIDTIMLFDATGDWKLSFERQITKTLDGRAEMAKNLVEQYLAEVEGKTVEFDIDTQLVYNLLRSMFFSKKGFKFSPSLNQFLLLDASKIHDARLKKAHTLLKESIHIDKSNWYAHVHKYVIDARTQKGEYQRLTLSML
jgi:hypothetical protein